jgi:hypothetical protein
MRVLTIFVRTGTVKFATAEDELALLFRRQLSGVSRDVVVVDTALRPGEVERQSGRVVIGGDNAAREFSAFDSGLAFVGEDLGSYDLVNLTTAAFRQLYADYLERFTPAVLSAASVRPVCVGHIDCYNEPIRVRGCISQHWVRTSCVFLAPTELQILGSLVSERERSVFFSGDPSGPFRQDAPLSPAYQRFISDWLTGKDIGQGVTWHSRLELNQENLPEFERKALAILNEHLFALRLRAAGCRIVDVTWLSGQMARRPASEVDWSTPWWRQLAERDRHAIRVGQTPLLAS